MKTLYPNPGSSTTRRVDIAQVLDSADYVEGCRRTVERKLAELQEARNTLVAAERRHKEIRSGR